MLASITSALILRSMGVFLLFLMHTVLAQSAGVGGYGNFTFTLSVVMVLSIISGHGWPVAVLRYSSQYLAQGEWSLLKGVILKSHFFVLVSSFSLSLIILLLIYFLNLSYELKLSMIFVALLVPLLTMTKLRRRTLQGLKRVSSSIIPDDILLPIIVIIVCVIYVPSNGKDILGVYLGSAIIVLIVGYLVLYLSVPVKARVAKSDYHTRTWLNVSLPLMFGGVGHVLLVRTDTIMLGVITDVHDVGLYGAASKVALFSVIILGAIELVITPRLSAMFNSGDSKGYLNMVKLSSIAGVVATLPLLVGMFVWSDEILRLFGEDFSQGGVVLKILVVGYFFKVVAGVSSAALSVCGRERLFSKIIIFSAVFNIAGNFIAISYFGYIGAAIVTAMVTAVMSLCSMYYAFQLGLLKSKVSV